MSANNIDPARKPHHVASDLGLYCSYCLPMALLQDSM